MILLPVGSSSFQPSYCFPLLTLTRSQCGPMSEVPLLQQVHLHPRRRTRHRVAFHPMAAAVASPARRQRTGNHRRLSAATRRKRRGCAVARSEQLCGCHHSTTEMDVAHSLFTEVMALAAPSAREL
jgi:hypothetical protein